jgi:hypothetical protein
LDARFRTWARPRRDGRTWPWPCTPPRPGKQNRIQSYDHNYMCMYNAGDGFWGQCYDLKKSFWRKNWRFLFKLPTTSFFYLVITLFLRKSQVLFSAENWRWKIAENYYHSIDSWIFESRAQQFFQGSL